MPWGAVIGAGASIIGSAIGGGGGGSGSGGQNAPYQYIPTAQPQIDQNLQGLLSQGNTAAQSTAGLNPLYAQYAGQIQNNPYTSQNISDTSRAANQYNYNASSNLGNAQMLFNQGTAATQGMNQAAQTLQGQYGNAAAPASYASPIWGAAQNTMGRLNTLGDSTAAAGQSVWNTAQDPQSALYNRTQQQVSDQQNAQLAMSGLSGSPYGAGVANQGLSNFNIDWQNQQLQRQLAGLGGLQGANTSAGGLYTSGLDALESGGTTAANLQSQAASNVRGLGTDISNIYSNSTANLGRTLAGQSDLQQLGAQNMQQFAQLPYQNYNAIQGNNIGALNSQAQGAVNSFAPTQQIINDYQSYLGLGQSANQNALNAQNQQFNQGQQQGANLGAGLGGLSNGLGQLFGGGSQAGGGSFWDSIFGGGGSGNYPNAQAPQYIP